MNVPGHCRWLGRLGGKSAARARALGMLALVMLWAPSLGVSAQPSGVELHSVSVSGAHPAAASREVVRRGLGAVARCYSTRQAEGATAIALRGALRLRIYIVSDGRPVAAAAEAFTVADAALVECAREASLRWRFPASRASSDVRVTLTFGGGSATELTRAVVVRHDGRAPEQRLPTDARPDPLPAPESIVSLAEPRVSGVSSAVGYRRALMRRVFTLRRCYDVERARHPELSGIVVIHYLVGPDGRVTVAYAEDDQFSNAAVVDCVLRLVRRTVFPVPQGGPSAAVVQAIAFQPPPERAGR